MFGFHSPPPFERRAPTALMARASSAPAGDEARGGRPHGFAAMPRSHLMDSVVDIINVLNSTRQWILHIVTGITERIPLRQSACADISGRARSRGRARVFFFFFPAPRSRVFAPGVARAARRRAARSGPFKVTISGFVKYPCIGECDFVWVAIGPGFASRVKVRRPPAARPRKTERKPPSGDSGRPAAQAPPKWDRGGGGSRINLWVCSNRAEPAGGGPRLTSLSTPDPGGTSPLRRPARNRVRSRARAAKRGPARFFLLVFLVLFVRANKPTESAFFFWLLFLDLSFGQTHRKGARARGATVRPGDGACVRACVVQGGAAGGRGAGEAVGRGGGRACGVGG